MAQLFINNARGVLAESISTGATLIRLKDHANIPASLAADDYFLMTLFRDTTRYGENLEVVKVTAVTVGSDSQLNLTVERGFEYPAQIHTAGARLEGRLTAQSLYALLSDAKTYTDTAVAGLLDTAPEALNTLNELADALNNDPDFAATMATQLGQKLNAAVYTAEDVLAKLLTVHGESSGLDADTLRGAVPDDFEIAGATQAHIEALDPHPQYVKVDDGATLDWQFATGHYTVDNGERLETTAAQDVMSVTGSGKQAFGPNAQLRNVPAGAVARTWDPVTGEARGVVTEKAGKNLLKYSEAFEASGWSKHNAYVSTTDYSGLDGKHTTKAVVATQTSFPRVAQRLQLTANTRYTLSLVVRSGNVVFVHGTVELPGEHTLRFYADLVTSSARTHLSHGTITGEVTVTDTGRGFSLIALTVDIPEAGPYDVFFGPSSAYGSPNATIGDFIYADYAQLELGDKPTSYMPTPAVFEGRASTGTYLDANGDLQTAAADEPRENHVLVDGEWVSQGLLIEPSATNLFIGTNDYTSTAWELVRPERKEVDTSYHGFSRAKVIPSSTDHGTQSLRQFYSFVARQTYTYSVTLEAAEYSAATLVLALPGGSAHYHVNVKTGEIEASAVGTEPAYTIEVHRESPSRLRFSVTGTAQSSASGLVDVRVSNTWPVTGTWGQEFAGDGTSGLYVMGHQLEEGSKATSFIPTLDAAVTRAADITSSSEATRDADDLTRTLTAEYNPSQGTWIVDAQVPAGEPVLTLGEQSLVSDSDDMKRHVLSYDTPIKARQVTLGHGAFKRVRYIPRSNATEATA